MPKIMESHPSQSCPPYGPGEIVGQHARVNRLPIVSGEDELAHSDLDLVNILADSFAMAIAEKENEGFLNGTGWAAGQQPDGTCVDTTVLGNAATTAAVGAVTVEDFLDTAYACPAKHRECGAFVVYSFTELALTKLRAEGSTTSDEPFL